ncbi:DHS-like NAD/FAD-binding domain-containing protein [Pavlovales sp. CCMP2436]|nr:DHS-like NAD/FAD-binding domain-containing protein [Pavlovales sp. CCMP2436]
MESAFKVHLAVQGVVSRALQDVLDGTLVVPGCVPGLPTRGDVSQAAAPRATPAARPAEDEEDVDSIHIAQLLAEAQKVIVMAGAGLSTAAGIPDFRTPGSGLYYQLEKYDLPNPQAVFSIDYFRVRPEPFHMLAREMWPGKFAPTAAHAFIKMLADKGKLLRCYTQNIDGLERLAGESYFILIYALSAI